MIVAHTYDASLAKRLLPLIKDNRWEDLTAVLNTLSNAQFRTAGTMLGASLTDELTDEKYWDFFRTMTAYNAKAFLGTLLKQVARRQQDATLSLQSDSAFKALGALSQSEIDVQKTLSALLPLMKSPEEAEGLFRSLNVTDYSKRIAPLLRTTTVPCAFLLLRALKYVEHDRLLLIRATHFIMSRGDSLSFNLASLLKTYFALEEVKGTFSLSLHPYELSRMEQSYPAFAEAMSRQ